MGFLSGIGNFVQNVGPTAGAVAEAQAQGSAQHNQQALQMIALQRQQRSAEFENLKNFAEANKSNAEAGTYTPQYAGAKAGAESAAQWPFVEQKLQDELNNSLKLAAATGQNAQQIEAMRLAGESRIEGQREAFEGSQGNLNRQNTADIATANRTATSANQTREQGAAQARLTQTQSGEVLPTLVHGAEAVGHALNPANWFSSPSTPSSTSTAPNPTGITDVERQMLKSQGYSDEQINSAYQVSP